VKVAQFLVSEYTHGMLSCGWIEATLGSPDSKAADLAAVLPLIVGAGGAVVDLHGDSQNPGEMFVLELMQPSKEYRLAAACNAGLLSKLLAVCWVFRNYLIASP